MNYKKLFKLFLVLTLLLCPIGAFAEENIDPDDDGSQYAWGENVGWLNFEADGDGGPGVEVSDSELTGYIWGENIGWINLSPIEGGVVNDGCGNLSGYAWAENVGWINFAPSEGGVFINPDTGVFYGYAWGENIGWINFAPTSGGVKTSWRGVSEGGLAVVSETKLTASDAAAEDEFGWSVAISGVTAVVGAGQDDDAGVISGSAYVFRYDGTNWVEEAKLTASDAAAGDTFGISVAISGVTAVVGAYGDDGHSGSAYVYELAADTPAGSCVVAQPVAATTGKYPVTLIFFEVIQAGVTSLTTSSRGLAPPPGYQAGDPPNYYDVTTTASFSGAVTVGIDYSGSSFVNEQELGLFHRENGEWADVTSSLDTTNDMIYGRVSSLSPFAIFEPVMADSDGDGVPDDMDGCLDSNIEATVIIDGCDSGVENHIFEDGCTMSDLIAQCAEDARNHGKFVSCVSHLTNDWKKEGLISGKEKGAIQSCAAQADIP